MNLFHRGPKPELPLVTHQGIFHRQISMWQGVFLIVSLTIGAGVLGIPYAVAKVGLLIGLVYIVGLGVLVVGLNLLIGEVVVRTRENLQLVGLAKKYLGRVGEILMVVIKFTSVAGILTIYIIGEGKTLAALFPGTVFIWSLIFFVVGSIFIFIGIRAIKVVDFWLSLGILVVILAIAAFTITKVEMINLSYFNLADFLLPYGVILFAFNGDTAVIEAHSILVKRNKTFKYTIIIAGIISIISYALFAAVVVGVTGINTTEVATIGLGNQLGKIMLIFGNVFAILAMATSFLTTAQSTRDSLAWDFKISAWTSALIVCLVPLVIFLLGLRQFIMAIDIVGGVFISMELLMMILIYWRAKQEGDLDPGEYKLHHTLLLAALLIIALIIGAIYSVVKLF